MTSQPCWVHYSRRVVSAVRSSRQEHEPDTKPRGFWISNDAAEVNWRSWCIDENFSLASLATAHDVSLASDSNLLLISSAAELDAFHEGYAAHNGFRRDYAIRWGDVASKYDGVLITPYIWERRLSDRAGWYYGWDCASGCIWNARAIASISPRQKQEAA